MRVCIRSADAKILWMEHAYCYRRFSQYALFQYLVPVVSKLRGSERALEAERQGPYQRTTNHECRAPEGALARRKKDPR